jgi:glutaredoxin
METRPAHLEHSVKRKTVTNRLGQIQHPGELLESLGLQLRAVYAMMATMIAQLPTLYTQIGCPECPRVRDWLYRHGVAFTERNVTGQMEFMNELVATGVFATPLLVVGDQMVLAFQPDALHVLLDFPPFERTPA